VGVTAPGEELVDPAVEASLEPEDPAAAPVDSALGALDGDALAACSDVAAGSELAGVALAEGSPVDDAPDGEGSPEEAGLSWLLGEVV
jgi:hypothetical protein